MKHYDAIVIGCGFGALCGAAYLSTRLSRVALFTNGFELDPRSSQAMHGTDAHASLLANLSSRALLGPVVKPYLEAIGIGPIRSSAGAQTVVKADGHTVSRPVDFEGFKRYLIRHNPKEIHAIHRFFDTLKSHAESFESHAKRRLNDEPFVGDTLHAEWGKMSLADVLHQAFKTAAVKAAFLDAPEIVKTPSEDISAVIFFRSWLARTPFETDVSNDAPTDVVPALKAALKHVDVYTDAIRECVVENNTVMKLLAGQKTRTADVYMMEEMLARRLIKQNRTQMSEERTTHVLERLRAPHHLHHAFVVFDEAAKSRLPQGNDVLFSPSEEEIAMRRMLKPDGAPLDDVTRLVAFHAGEHADEESLRVALSRVNGLDKHMAKCEMISTGTVLTKRFEGIQESLAVATPDNAWIFEVLDTIVPTAADGLINAVETGRNAMAWLISQTDAGKPLSMDVLFAAFHHAMAKIGFVRGEKNLEIAVGRRHARLRFSGKDGCFVSATDSEPDARIQTDYDSFYAALTHSGPDAPAGLNIEGDETFATAVRTSLQRTRVGRPRLPETTQGRLGRLALAATLLWVSLAYAGLLIWPVFWLPLVFLAAFTAAVATMFALKRRLVLHDIGVVCVFGVGALFAALIPGSPAVLMLAFAGSLLVISSFFDISFVAAYVASDAAKGYVNMRLYRRMMSGLTLLWGFMWIATAITGFWLPHVVRPLSLVFVIVGFYIHIRYPDVYIRSILKPRG